MITPREIWTAQCEAARGIRERFGTEKAVGYLVGEKLLEFLRHSDRKPELANELPNFVEEIQSIFSPVELRVYLDNVRRIGASGHTLTDEEYGIMREAEAFDDNIARGAEDASLVGRIRELLLGEDQA